MPAAERGRLPRRAALSSVGGCAAIITVLGGTAALLGHPQGKVQVLRAVPTGLCPPCARVLAVYSSGASREHTETFPGFCAMVLS